MKLILIIFFLLFSKTALTNEIDLGNNFYLDKKYENFAKISSTNFFAKCFPSLLNDKEKGLENYTVFLPTNIPSHNNLNLCNPGAMGILHYTKVNPTLSYENKFLFDLRGDDVKKMPEEDLIEFCTKNKSTFYEISIINNLELEFCRIRIHPDGHPMIYSAFTNGKQTMYNTVIFDESKNYDSGISLMFLRNKTRNITNDEFIEFTKHIWLNIFYKY